MMQKGALAAPFLFAGAAFAAAGSLVASPSLWLGALVAVLAAALCQPQRRTPGVTPLAVAVAAYATWTVPNDLFNSAYNAAGVFHPMFLVAGFVLARGCDEAERDRLFVALAGGALLLVLWGLWQAASGDGRAHAHFETPNTLATVVNLFLAPLAVAIALGAKRRMVLAAACLLAAGLAATLSRGGFVALAAGLGVAWLFSRSSFTFSASARVLGVLGAGGVLGALAVRWPEWAARSSAPGAQLTDLATTLNATLGSRGELYRLAGSIAGERPWTGIGYLGFHDLLEARRMQVPSYGAENITYFAHDDYLQTLVELGVPGVLLLLAIVALPFVLARTRSADSRSSQVVLCTLAALATMAVHAVGDFPFYVPLCLLLFGLGLGVVDRLTSGASVKRHWSSPWARFAAIVATAGLAFLLVLPPAAEAAAAYGNRNWRTGEGVPAAFGFELARRLQPRDWRYHWFAGQFWLAQARQGNRAAAQLADRAFAAATQANPAEPRPILGRLAIQLGFSPLLEQPQSATTLRGWAEHALELAPLNPAVRRDHAAALEQLSRAR